MSLSSKSPWRRAGRWLGAVLVGVVGVLATLVPAGAVHAHTAFSGSTPADGAVLDAPVSLVTLVFTGESEVAGDGFVVLDPSGQVRPPTRVTTLDDKVFTLTFDPPLAGGQIGVRWSVRAPDTHPIEGAFSFTVTSPATADVVAATPSTDVASESTPGADMANMSAAEMATMDEFLAVDTTRPGESQATVGRLLSFVAIALALGGVAFTATTLRGASGEIAWLLRGVRIAGGAVAIGAVVEYGGVARIAGDSLAGYWTSSPGFATVLRMLAGVLIAAGFTATTVAIGSGRPARSLSAATKSPVPHGDTSGFWNSGDAPQQSTAVLQRTDGPQRVLVAREDVQPSSSMSATTAPRAPARRWIPDRSSALGFIGCGVALVSFWFDGHTVSKGIRPLHALANSVHVLAGSVWVGGVVAVAAILWSRHRRGVPARALPLVLRFSAVASVALGAVVAAGLVMAVSVLDNFGDLTGTEWGQVLLLKTAAVGLALVAGAYNHFGLLPALQADPANPDLHARVRSVVTAEAMLLIFVVVATAWLVSAAT
jgi:copper transport protein